MAKGSGGSASAGRGTGAVSGGSGSSDGAGSTITTEAQAMALTPGWQKSLTKEEIAAIKVFNGGAGFARINEALRGERALSSKAAAQVKALDSALSKARTAKTVLLTRGVDAPELHARAAKGTLVGSAITNKGFASTTYMRRYARAYTNTQGTGGRTIIRLTVPKGSKAAYISKVGRRDSTGDGEILLSRNAKFMVKRARFTTVGGQRVLLVSATLRESS